MVKNLSQPVEAGNVMVYKDLDSVQLMALLTSALTVAQWMFPGAMFLMHPVSPTCLSVITDKPTFDYAAATAARNSAHSRSWTLYIPHEVVKHLKAWQDSKAATRKIAGIVIDKKFKF